MTTFPLGPYTVSRRHEADLYRVFLSAVLIGKCYSRPCESDCRWLELQMREQTGYAYSSAPLPTLSVTSDAGRTARYRKAGAPRKPETIADIAKAIAGG